MIYNKLDTSQIILIKKNDLFDFQLRCQQTFDKKQIKKEIMCVMGVVLILIPNIVTPSLHPACDAASVDESRESQHLSWRTKAPHLLLTFILIPRSAHGTSIAGTALVHIIHKCHRHTLLPLCRPVKLVCHRSSLPTLWVALNKQTKGQSQLLHSGDGCGRNSHSSRGINIGSLSRHFSTTAAHLIKVQTRCRGHISAWTSCPRTVTQAPEQAWAHVRSTFENLNPQTVSTEWNASSSSLAWSQRVTFSFNIL